MKKIDYTTIYNIPEGISGLGVGSHFIGICLFIALYLCIIPCILVDENWIKNIIELIISSGFLITLAWAFILILCPIYFFVRFIMEFVRTHREKYKFYSNPNIKYIKLNQDNVFFKNTLDKNDFSLPKSEIIEVILGGKIITRTIKTSKYGSEPFTYTEDLKLVIKTKKQSFTIYPQTLLSEVNGKVITSSNDFEVLEKQIAFYKTYFNNFDIQLEAKGSSPTNKCESYSAIHKLETGEISNNITPEMHIGIICKILGIAAFIYFIIKILPYCFN